MSFLDDDDVATRASVSSDRYVVVDASGPAIQAASGSDEPVVVDQVSKKRQLSDSDTLSIPDSVDDLLVSKKKRRKAAIPRILDDDDVDEQAHDDDMDAQVPKSCSLCKALTTFFSDASILVADDSMYTKSSSVKSSVLGPPIATRTSRSAVAAPADGKPVSVKRVKLLVTPPPPAFVTQGSPDIGSGVAVSSRPDVVMDNYVHVDGQAIGPDTSSEGVARSVPTSSIGEHHPDGTGSLVSASDESGSGGTSGALELDSPSVHPVSPNPVPLGLVPGAVMPSSNAASFAATSSGHDMTALGSGSSVDIAALMQTQIQSLITEMMRTQMPMLAASLMAQLAPSAPPIPALLPQPSIAPQPMLALDTPFTKYRSTGKTIVADITELGNIAPLATMADLPIVPLPSSNDGSAVDRPATPAAEQDVFSDPSAASGPSAKVLGKMRNTGDADPTNTMEAAIANMFNRRADPPKTPPSVVSDAASYLPTPSTATGGSLSPVKTEGGAVTPASPSPIKPARSKVLDDVSKVKVKYDPNAPCGVSNPQLQDPLLASMYSDAPSLPGDRKLVHSFSKVPVNESVIGGRVHFSSWGDSMTDASPMTIHRAIRFERSGNYINPSLVSPALMVLRPANAFTAGTYRLYVGSKVAILVSCGMCQASDIEHPRASSALTPRYQKVIELIFHNQCWERFVAFMCVCFGMKQLHASMKGVAMEISTKLNPIGVSKRDLETKHKRPPKSMTRFFSSPSSSPVKTEVDSGAGPMTYPEDYSLAYDAIVPVFDARNTVFNFDTDIPVMSTKLARWEGDVPVGAFVVVGYSASTYYGTIKNVKTLHLGCNLLWIVVCGTTSQESDSDSSDG
ncbi:hypothetical protein DFH09DRAFT_1497437 [Mycena vulgaris]|nr:hypothetical protein DFH09DRAFT_1497437 [Mycena vulgaris]